MQEWVEFVQRYFSLRNNEKAQFAYINIVPVIMSMIIAGNISVAGRKLLSISREISFVLTIPFWLISFYTLALAQSKITNWIGGRFNIDEETKKQIRKIYLLSFFAIVFVGCLLLFFASY